ncbi:uncharacterized protein EV420DRAFT_525172 [Desarmillaria tabescens]|uniref:Uncharacterized protein n=1 Tax=Armillaria tabescens TaxID=1929756 RepID=A0AA39N4X2_ARMTA|nr:uncharacterized protein EV420DRAFT_525172 [Desarmillaria tabescens]KAK0457400.1 hypothetical protein EV420DRAFT_525172 [Desarmillaria tabescens]
MSCAFVRARCWGSKVAIILTTTRDMFLNLKKLAGKVARLIEYAKRVCIRIFEAMLPHAVHYDDQAEMNVIQHQIIPLQESERMLATRYGMAEDFDSVEVFSEAKKRAFAGDHHDRAFKDLQELDRLNELRLRLAGLRLSTRAHAVTPPAN